jgi:hypothetical protein
MEAIKPTPPASSRHLTPQALATAGGYVVALGLCVLWAFIFKVGASGSVATAGSRALGVGCISMLAVGVALLTSAWRRSEGSRATGFFVPVFACVFILVTCAAALEVAVRMLAKPHPMGESVGARVLIPYDWDATRRSSLLMLERSRKSDSYYVESGELGWQVGSSRRSQNGLYTSSAEGLRSARQGEGLAEVTRSRRIAVFGDSFAFSEEVPFEHSLTFHLERQLKAGTQVANFGVPGYGIDQAVLRFERESARWRPDVAVLQFINDDIKRISSIYLFNKPQWMLPFVKPRFTLNNGALRQLDVPSPDDTFGKASVFDLPHLAADSTFEEGRWRSFPLSWSYALRLVGSLSPPQFARSSDELLASEEDIAVALIERFVASAHAIGTVPVVVFFPDKAVLRGASSAPHRIISALAERSVVVVDTTKCMLADHILEDFTERGDVPSRATDGAPAAAVGETLDGGHYSNAGNARMARCLASLLR